MLSACVQMPSLPAIPLVERRTGLPTLSAATATAHQLLAALELEPLITDAGPSSPTPTARSRAHTLIPACRSRPHAGPTRAVRAAPGERCGRS